MSDFSEIPEGEMTEPYSFLPPHIEEMSDENLGFLVTEFGEGFCVSDCIQHEVSRRAAQIAGDKFSIPGPECKRYSFERLAEEMYFYAKGALRSREVGNKQLAEVFNFACIAIRAIVEMHDAEANEK